MDKAAKKPMELPVILDYGYGERGLGSYIRWKGSKKIILFTPEPNKK